MKVPSFELTQQYAELRSDLLKIVDDVMASGHFILGENVKQLEAEVARYLDAAHGIGVANGSDALNIALMAFDIGPGDEVIVPAFTFFATAGAVTRTGATPVIVDVDPETFNLTPAAVATAITPRTKAIIPVHLYGQAAEMEAIMAIARDHDLKVIEDAAQAIGAKRNGQSVCTFGDFGTLSFFPTKNLGAFGDAGMVITMDDGLAARTRLIRAHGAKVKYYHEVPGYNSRLDELQAAILKYRLGHLERWNEKRKALAANYTRLFEEAGLGEQVKPPVTAVGNEHVFHQYTLRAARRDELAQHLKEAGVGTSVYYPVPLHLQPVFADLGGKPGDLPVSEQLCRDALSLPMFPELADAQQEYVVAKITEFYTGRTSA